MDPYQDENDLDMQGQGLPAPAQPPGPIPPLGFDPAALKSAEDSAQNQKMLIALTGGVGDALANRQSFGNVYSGKMNQENHSASNVAKAVADNVDSPMARQAKLYENYMNAKKMQDSRDNSDATSQRSQNYSQMLSSAFPQFAKSFDGKSNEELQQMAPILIQKVRGDEDRAARLETARARDLDRKDARTDKADTKRTDQDQKDSVALDNTLSKGWAARSGQAGVVQAKINNAEAAEALLAQAKSQDGGLDARQIEELSQATAKLLGGGGNSASARVDALVPHTFWGNTQKMSEYLTNNPKGADMQAFTDRLAETVAREKALAQDQQRAYQVQSLAPYARLRNSNPELYNQILESKGLTPGVVQQVSAKTSGKSAPTTSDHEKAVAWAMKNPNDPRSAEILRINAKQAAGDE